MVLVTMQHLYNLGDNTDYVLVITGSGDNNVRVFDAKSGALKRTFKGHKYVVNCIMVRAFLLLMV